MINIKSFKKGKGQSGNSQNNSGNGGGGYYTTTIEPHYLWGNMFDGTQNVNGTIYSPNINNSGYISTNTISGNSATFGNLTVTGDSTLRQVQATDITSHNVVPASGDTFDLGSLVRYWNNLYARNIKCTNLDVTGLAHFKELVIDKVTATNGEIVISPGNFHIDAILATPNVESEDDGWLTAYNLLTSQAGIVELPEQIYLCKIGQLKYDPVTGVELKQQLRVGDYLYCSSFNIGEGTHSNVSNQYYRTIVTEVGTTTLDGVDYLYATIMLYYEYTDVEDVRRSAWLNNCGDVQPKVGDDLVVLGSTSPDRQSAIILSSVNGIDQTVSPPSITQYKGINLITQPIGNYKYITIGSNGNVFKGTFLTQNGATLEELINQQQSPVYLHTAYSITDSGVGFTKTPQSGVTYNYLGMCVNKNVSDSGLIFSDYQWSFLDNSNTQYKLVVLNEYILQTLGYNHATDIIDDRLNILFQYKIIKTTSTGVVELSPNDPVQLSGHFLRGEGDINFTRLQDGSYYYTKYINNYSESEDWGFYREAEINLLVNGDAVESRHVRIEGDSQSMLSVSQSIQARVQDVAGNYSTLSMRADAIETSVHNLSGQTSTFRQTYDQFVLSLYDGLTRTGIDITNHTIAISADNFLVKNNNNVNTLYVNSQGLVETKTGYMTNPQSGLTATFYPTFYALSMNRFSNDPLAYSFGLSGYDKAVNGQPRLSYNGDYTDSVWTDWFNFSAKEYNANSTVSYRIPELTMESHDFTFNGGSNIQNYGAVAGKYNLKISTKDGIACTWVGGGTPIIGQTKDINGNDASGIVGWSGGTEKFLCFGPAGVVIKDGVPEIILAQNSLSEWITAHGSQWRLIPVGGIVRVKDYSSDRYSTLICKERD